MHVTEVLNKITDRNAPVIGCIARNGERTHHNLGDFDIDCDRIADTVDELLTVTDYLEQDSGEVDTICAEFGNHCIIGKRVDDSILIAVTEHMQRAGFKKLQVGLSLQTRTLTKALLEAPAPEVATPQVVAEPEEPAPAPIMPSQPTDATPPVAAYMAAAQNLQRPAIPDPLAGASVQPTKIAEEPSKKGKVRKVYRGTVYWE